MNLFALSALASAALLSSSVEGYETFLAKIPNGSLFGKWLGHGTSDYTAFGNDFIGAGEWTKELCGMNFAGAKTKMTYGEAFGDPCCTWKAGGKVETITAWAKGSVPQTATVCAANKPVVTPAPAATTKAPTPAATTKAPTPAATTKAPTPAATTKSPTPATTPKKTNAPGTKKPSCKKNRRV